MNQQKKISLTKTSLITVMALSFVLSTSLTRGTPLGLPASNLKRLSAQLQNFDIRLTQPLAAASSPTRAQLAAVARLRRQAAHDLQISFNRATATPRHLFSLDSFLTPSSGDVSEEIALDFVRANSDLFSLTSEEIDALCTVKNYVTQHNGVTHLAFQQQVRGIEVFQSDLRANLDAEGRIISMSGDYFPGNNVLFQSKLTAAEAVARAVEAAFPDVPFSTIVKQPATGRNQLTVFHRGDFADEVTARLTIFPAPDRARLGWRVRVHFPEQSAWYDMVVDAETGEMLYSYNLYFFDQPQGLVFDTHPGAGPQVLKSFVGDSMASPATWVLPAPNMKLLGNNVLAIPSATNADRHFQFPFANTYSQAGMNKFDLDKKNLRFTPNMAGGYDVSILPLTIDTLLGTNQTASLVPNRDDGSVFFRLGFNFPFFGTTYTALHINANGNVTFTGPSSLFVESPESLTFGLPRIACFWDDLDFGDAGGLFAKTVGTPATKAVFTWNLVPEEDAPTSNTFQLTLSNDGTIEMAFNGIGATDGLVGITRGMGELALRHVDLSASPPVKGLREGFFERFPAVELDAAATNLFYHLNFMHDALYRLGFDEAAGNFQADNFGRGGLGNDPVIGLPQSTGTNNATFGTPEDGLPPRARFFLFTNPPLRQVDPAFDADVIYHEYTHGLLARLIGGPQNISVFSGLQSFALAEGWGDAFSTSFTNDPILGEYSTGNSQTGIRSVAFNQNQLKYGDLANRFGELSGDLGDGGVVGNGPIFFAEPHEDGEIWASALWDLRTSLGKQVYERLITDGLKFTPPNPSMLEARDAILLADKANHRSANTPTIWSVFAARGMGFSAQSGDGSDLIVFEAFDTPADPLPPVKDVLFSDDMERGVGAWTVIPSSGLWHQSNRRSSGGATAWYYGLESSGDYDNGATNFGALVSPRITLPAISGTSALVLEFDQFMRNVSTLPLFGFPDDCGFVRIVDTATGRRVQKALVYNNTLTTIPFVETQFEKRAINISEFAGKTIQVQFYFDTLDRFLNFGEGWFIDNVRVSLRSK
jgi:hypothetical protein